MVKYGIAYGIVYDGGFDVTNDLRRLRWDLECNSNVEVDRCSSYDEAYWKCCTKYSGRFLDKHSNVQYKFPKLLEIIENPYHEPSFKANVPQKRFFATMNPEWFTIYDNIDNLMDFIIQLNLPFIIKEFEDYEAALKFINRRFMMYILSRSAYIHGDLLCRIESIELNKLHSTQGVVDWFNQNYCLPQSMLVPTNPPYQQNYLPFPQSQPIPQQQQIVFQQQPTLSIPAPVNQYQY